jgi:hypothetical protein
MNPNLSCVQECQWTTMYGSFQKSFLSESIIWTIKGQTISQHKEVMDLNNSSTDQISSNSVAEISDYRKPSVHQFCTKTKKLKN